MRKVNQLVDWLNRSNSPAVDMKLEQFRRQGKIMPCRRPYKHGPIVFAPHGLARRKYW